ncbi:hypothetical protein F5890DRAFT_1558510 [Lentinula detonsa]|uniref:Uncharacterized protein n=1 Tax=Lentinula detonsa TaxID=2804962 RepID=A0AA38UM97_9AGAR|nr:hypothetical protein F5890DRAFT_1558510 [Lentinula detonsa]
MIARNGKDNESNEDSAPETAGGQQESSSQPQLRSTCSRCVLVGKTVDCRPQNASRPTQACIVCHQQRQHCSWSGNNAARRMQAKRSKTKDDIYEGPAARVEERRFEGPGIPEQLAAIVVQNNDMINIARRSLVMQEKMLGILARRERREIEAKGGSESEREEDEDEDGEGEDDEEEVEETKRREQICKGKKRVE